MENKTVVVTGASGYIGGQISLQLKDQGYKVIGVDRRHWPDHLDEYFDYFVVNEFDNSEVFDVLARENPTAIIHCAGTSLVGPSHTDPNKYYYNNFCRTLNLVEFIVSNMPNCRLIFSSSAAVYGDPIMVPCSEVDPCEPISPYGESKRIVEQMLVSYNSAYKLDYVAFRYFNACGADSQARHGQESQATHIIARVLESVKDNTQFVCNGQDYSTPDGTCVRDYVHVQDIADAHLIALDRTLPSGIYNIGTAAGVSNLEVVQTAKEVTGNLISVEFGPRRTGDPAILTADPTRFQTATGWLPKYSIRDMVQHAWNWYNK
jgi:UDP-glucose 4-epimerase